MRDFTLICGAKFQAVPATLFLYPLGQQHSFPTQTTRVTEGNPCLPTSSVKYVHLLASVLPPCGVTHRAFLIAHDVN